MKNKDCTNYKENDFQRKDFRKGCLVGRGLQLGSWDLKKVHYSGHHGRQLNNFVAGNRIILWMHFPSSHVDPSMMMVILSLIF